jgi:hypothetical protein
METIRIRDGKKSDPGKNPGSATLLPITIRYLLVIIIYLQKHNVKVFFTGKPEVQNLNVPCLVGSRYT